MSLTKMVQVIFRGLKQIILKLTDDRIAIVTDKELILRLKTSKGWVKKRFDYNDLLIMNFIINEITKNKDNQIKKLRKKLKKLRKETDDSTPIF